MKYYTFEDVADLFSELIKEILNNDSEFDVYMETIRRTNDECGFNGIKRIRIEIERKDV